MDLVVVASIVAIVAVAVGMWYIFGPGPAPEEPEEVYVLEVEETEEPASIPSFGDVARRPTKDLVFDDAPAKKKPARRKITPKGATKK